MATKDLKFDIKTTFKEGGWSDTETDPIKLIVNLTTTSTPLVRMKRYLAGTATKKDVSDEIEQMKTEAITMAEKLYQDLPDDPYTHVLDTETGEITEKEVSK